MNRVYRILRRLHAKTPFDGEGSYRYGGRWSSVGTRIVYTAEHLSLAMIEYFVRIESDASPGDLVLATAEIPDGVSRISIALGQLPKNWRFSPAPRELARIGDRFVDEGRAAILMVPSVLAPSESNWLINPRHAEFPRVRIRSLEPFYYDHRFFRQR